jgi:hypothetical protein
MNRFLALLLALLFATLTVSSACVAAPSEFIRFTLEPERGSANIHATFRDQSRGEDHSNWSSGFASSELVGLDLAGFRSGGTRPLRFAVIREAGRLDCEGRGGESFAAGSCSFTPDAGFMQLLESRGIGRPTRDQAFGLMAINARRDLIDAVVAAHYPTPTIDNLMALTALGITRNYIDGLARVGYRPRTIQTLIEFKALGISPEWIGGFTRIGYGNVPGEELVQLRALNVTPEFITGFERIGYRNIPPSTLVQLKALNITPDFVRTHVAQGQSLPAVNELVEMKIFGKRR